MNEPSTMAFEAVLGMVRRRGGADFLGDGAALATEAYRASLIGPHYPSFWLEVPYLGEPGFDLHVYYDRGQVEPLARFSEGNGFGMQGLFDWFFAQETGGVGVGFAHDLRDGRPATGAYVNFNQNPLQDASGFFCALGAQDACANANALMERMTAAWRPWYLGLFPERPGAGARVGAFVAKERQEDYARDARELSRDLEQAGFEAFDGEMLARLQALAALPYQLELQLDAGESGTGDTLGADLTLCYRSSTSVHEDYAEGGAALRAGALFEEWGIADGRWRLADSVSFAKMVPVPLGEGLAPMLMTCIPAFIKAKWAGGTPQGAKVYLQCATRLLDI